MSSSAPHTPSRGGNKIRPRGTYTTPGRRALVQTLPTVRESSVDSLDSKEGGVPLSDTIPPSNPFAAPWPKSKTASDHQSKTVENSPANSSNRSSSIRHSSQLSEPTGLHCGLQTAKYSFAFQKLLAMTEQNTPKLDPSTAEFKPAATQQAPATVAQQAMGSNTVQPKAGDQFDGAATVTDTTLALSTFPHHTGGVSSQAFNTPQAYNTFPAQSGGFQTKAQVTLQNNHGMTVVNGTTPQSAPGAFNGAGGVSYPVPNGDVNQQQQILQQQQQQQLQLYQQQQYLNPNAMAFGAPNNLGAQYSANMSQALVVRDGNAPQQPINTNTTGVGFTAPNGNNPQYANNTNGFDGANTGAGYAYGAQQHGSVPQSMSAFAPQSSNGMAAVANGSLASSFEQMSMSTLQAHLDQGNQYAQTRTNMAPALPQSNPLTAQYNLFDPHVGELMGHNHFANTPMMRPRANTAHSDSTPIASSTMYGSTGGSATPSQYMESPSYRGRTDPRSSSYDTRTSVSNEPPPRFDLQTSVPVPQQGYGNVVSPSSSVSQLPSRGTTVSPDQSSSSNSVVDPFNGPAPPSVIRPIEPQSAVVPYEHTVPIEIRNMRSSQLNELTAGPTGRPRPETALDAANFPFVESARNAQPNTQCGVVKLKSVCLRNPLTFSSITPSNGRPADNVLTDSV
jgi:hypothetical protein